MRFAFLAVFVTSAAAQVSVILDQAKALPQQQPVPECFRIADRQSVACQDTTLRDLSGADPGCYTSADGQYGAIVLPPVPKLTFFVSIEGDTIRRMTVTTAGNVQRVRESHIYVPFGLASNFSNFDATPITTPIIPIDVFLPESLDVTLFAPPNDPVPQLMSMDFMLLDPCFAPTPSTVLPWMLVGALMAVAFRKRHGSPQAGQVDIIHVKPIAECFERMAKAIEWLAILLGPRWATLVIFMLLLFGAYALYNVHDITIRLLDLIGRAVASVPWVTFLAATLMIATLLSRLLLGRKREEFSRTCSRLRLHPSYA